MRARVEPRGWGAPVWGWVPPPTHPSGGHRFVSAAPATGAAAARADPGRGDQSGKKRVLMSGAGAASPFPMSSSPLRHGKSHPGSCAKSLGAILGGHDTQTALSKRCPHCRGRAPRCHRARRRFCSVVRPPRVPASHGDISTPNSITALGVPRVPPPRAGDSGAEGTGAWCPPLGVAPSLRHGSGARSPRPFPISGK